MTITTKLNMLIMAIIFFNIYFVSLSLSETLIEVPRKPRSNTEKTEEIKKEMRSISFAFYGKVVDLDGNPVPDAQIIMRVTYVPILSTKIFEQKEIRIDTDGQGLFMLREDGFQLELDRIEKPGYDYRFQYNHKRGFRFHKDEKKAELGQFPDQPIVFKVRKMGIPTLILGTNAAFGLHPGGKPAFFDLLWQQWAFPKEFYSVSGTFKGWHPDLKIYLEGNQQDCRLILEALDADTGIVVDKRELFEAPLVGYRPRVVIPFEAGKGVHTYAYVKGRGERFYTRMDIRTGIENIDDPEKQVARLDINYRTNPNGEGNFESSAELAKQYYEAVFSGKRQHYGYDPNAKVFSTEDVRKLLGK